MKNKIGIITTTIRPGRVGLSVAKWVEDFAKTNNNFDSEYNIIDIADYTLPLFGDTSASEENLHTINKWKEVISQHSSFIIVTAEYNHSATGIIKNALDYLKPEIANKPVAFVGYGSLGGARAIESLRIVLAELQVPTTQKTTNFLLAIDFENYTVFKPANHHAQNMNIMLQQLNEWDTALKTITDKK